VRFDLHDGRFNQLERGDLLGAHQFGEPHAIKVGVLGKCGHLRRSCGGLCGKR
jgi:hypothetical protein